MTNIYLKFTDNKYFTSVAVSSSDDNTKVKNEKEKRTIVYVKERNVRKASKAVKIGACAFLQTPSMKVILIKQSSFWLGGFDSHL